MENRTKTRALSASFMLALSVAVPYFANAEPASSPSLGSISNPASSSTSGNEGVAYFGENGNRRSVKTIEGSNGLEFNLSEGDSINVTDKKVYVHSSDGETLLEVTPDMKEDEYIWKDKDSNKVFVVSSAPSFRKCTNNKWAHWGIKGLWDGLVCVPAMLGTTPGTPATQIVVGAACHTAGEGLVTAAKC